MRLSREQQSACQDLVGPVRIVAGAGTGKTTVIAERIKRLLKSGVPESEILVLTFSQRAATQIRQRIGALVGPDELSNVGTFHAFALRCLREYGTSARRSSIKLLTGASRWVYLRELMWELGNPALVKQERPDDLVKKILQLMERLKQELISPTKFHGWARGIADPSLADFYLGAAQLYREYSLRCRQEGWSDFDDLIQQLVFLISEQDKVKSELRRRYQWILVDEYQDCNFSQERLIELLSAPDGNVCVVGDDDQSIYRFRGASKASLERFSEVFPSSKTVELGANRRSSRRIVDAAKAVIEQSSDRLDKPIRATPGAIDGDQVEFWECPDAVSEELAIRNAIVEQISQGVAYQEIAILGRTHAIVTSLIDSLRAEQIPVQHWSAPGLFKRPEILDLVAYLRLISNPRDIYALLRILTRPPLEVNLTHDLIRSFNSSEQPLDLLEEDAGIWAAKVLEMIPLKLKLGIPEIIFEVLNQTRHLEAITPTQGAQRARIIANVNRFSEIASEYCERYPNRSLDDFVEYLDLLQESGVDEPEPSSDEVEPAVQVMSIHQAKGLEFEVVIIPSLVDGRLPQPRRTELAELTGSLLGEVGGKVDHLAEERRLLYVAMTRARKKLYISSARSYGGAKRWKPSRFIADLISRPEIISVSEKLLPTPPGEEVREGVQIDVPIIPPVGDKLKLSFSSISTYLECPKQHWFRYHLRVPPKPVVEAQLGGVVHEVLKAAGMLRQQGEEITGQLLESLYEEAWSGTTLADPRRFKAMYELGWELLYGFWQGGGLEAVPHLVETPFTIDFGEWQLTGIIDRIDKIDEGWKVIDYKTGRQTSANKDTRDLQLAYYALAADQMGMHPLSLEFVYLRDGSHVKLSNLEESKAEALRLGMEIAHEIRKGNFASRPDRRRCQLCSYRLTCLENI